MPELPEVETVVNDLRTQGLCGRTILKAHVFWARSIAVPGREMFLEAIRNECIESLIRRAKFIVMRLRSGRQLRVHLRMTGRFSFSLPDVPRDPHEHVLLDLDDGRQLRFRDTRKFGRWYLLEPSSEKLDALGPEPLEPEFTREFFSENLKKYDRQIKPLLLDQSFLAGLGNIYVDEALWHAGIHPARRSGSLNAKNRDDLHAAIIKVLRLGIQNLGTSLGAARTNFYSVGGRRGSHQDALKVFRRTGEPCPRCGNAIKRLIVAQRSTHVCLRCQRPPQKSSRRRGLLLSHHKIQNHADQRQHDNHENP